MRTRIYNARILTMEEKRPVFKGEIYIDGGKIFRIKEAKTEKSERTEKPALNEEEKWDEEIDAEGNLIMPGFKNAHTHSAMTFLRSYADDMKLQEWLFDKVFPAEAKLTSDDVYHLTKLAILEYLTSGITAAFDMYKLKQDSAKAAEELGFRMVFCGDINDFGGTLEEMEQDYFRYQCEETPLLSYQFGFHAEYTTSRNLMEGIAQLAGKYKKPVYVHCSETKREVEECREKTGMTPIAYMDSLGLFENGGGLFHGVHLDEADFDIMKKKKICVVTNPASNLKLASGIAPVKTYLEKGIPVGPGTKDYGALSLAVQYYAKPYIVANVPPNCFMPRPKVGSAVIRLERHEHPPVEVRDEKLMFRVIRASFNQRRKTLANGLKNSPEIDFSKEEIEGAIEKLGKGASVRGEALTLAEFAQLANHFCDLREK